MGSTDQDVKDEHTYCKTSNIYTVLTWDFHKKGLPLTVGVFHRINKKPCYLYSIHTQTIILVPQLFGTP